jgi:hypothetical protein
MAVLVLTNASVTIAGTDLSDHANNVQLTYELDSVEVTAFGDSGHKFTGGLQNNQVQIDLFQDFASLKTEATIYPLVGTAVTVVIKPVNTTTSSTNPAYTITSAFLASHTPVMGAVGEIAKTSLTFTGGTLVKTTSP